MVKRELFPFLQNLGGARAPSAPRFLRLCHQPRSLCLALIPVAKEFGEGFGG